MAAAPSGRLKIVAFSGNTHRPSRSWNLFDADVLHWLLERKFSLELLRQFTELRLAIEPAGAALAARYAGDTARESIFAGYRRMEAAEAGDDDPLDADIAFHVAVLQASGNPFYAQFRDVVSTALQTSIRFTNRIVGRTASLPHHYAVFAAIEQRQEAAAAAAMEQLIIDVMALIDAAEKGG